MLSDFQFLLVFEEDNKSRTRAAPFGARKNTIYSVDIEFLKLKKEKLVIEKKFFI